MAQSVQTFGEFRMDIINQCVWREHEEIRLTPKAFAVLRTLLDQPGQLVRKEEFFRRVWPASVVSEAALTVCIRELRCALRDDARRPRYIETLHRRGFRLMRTVVTSQWKSEESITRGSMNLP